MGTGQGEQRAGGEFAAVVAQAETLVTEQPGDGAFDHPAAPAEPAIGLDAAAGDAGEDAAAAQIGAAAGEVVALVGVQLRRAAAAAGSAAAGPLDRGGGIEQRLEQPAVVGVRRGQQRGKGDPGGVDQDVVLGAALAPIGGVRAGQLAPLFARTPTPSRQPADQSINPAGPAGPAAPGAAAPTPRPAATPATAARPCSPTRSPAPGADRANRSRWSRQTESPPTPTGRAPGDGHQDPAPAAGAESAARPPPTARRGPVAAAGKKSA